MVRGMDNLEFTRLVEQYNRLIFTVCQRFVTDYQEAENLTQETFLTAFRAIDNFVGDNYKPWLTRIAVNKCKDFLKSAYHRTTQPTEDELLDCHPDSISIAEQVESSEQLEIIHSVCDDLPEPYRQVAILYYLEDQSFDDIAQTLNRPVKTVQTQAYRARDKLKKKLKEEIANA